MWVYYTVLFLFFLFVGIKVVEVTADTLKNQRDSVRKQDFLDSFIETLLTK